MTDKYYLNQEYILKCIERKKYNHLDYNDEYFSIDGDIIYEIAIIIGHKDDKLYFPFIQYSKLTPPDCIYPLKSEQYGDIFINYNTIEDVYNFIKTLFNEFPKDILIPKDTMLVMGIIEVDLEHQFKSEYKLRKSHTIQEQFTLEYFINKIDNIINIDKYKDILEKCVKQYAETYLGRELTRPLTNLALPWMNNDKLKQDYPNLKKWL